VLDPLVDMQLALLMRCDFGLIHESTFVVEFVLRFCYLAHFMLTDGSKDFMRHALPFAVSIQ